MTGRDQLVEHIESMVAMCERMHAVSSLNSADTYLRGIIDGLRMALSDIEENLK